jgi:hypothetical protein
VTRINETLLLETFLADLRSDDLLLRELAVCQLCRFTHFPQTIAALTAAEAVEENPDLKKQIKSLIQLVSAEKRTGTATALPDTAYLDESRITDDWLSGRISGHGDLLDLLGKLPEKLRTRAAATIIDNETELYRLIPFFSWPPEIITSPDVLGAFVTRLKDNDSIFTLRLISFLSAHSPALLTKNLQILLRSKNALVRSEAIKFLFKVSRPHALRLLEESILSSEKSRRSASTFLLLLPFNDIKHVVLSLIECGSLRDEFLQKLIYHLVYNNPDMDFFKRLTVIELLRKDEIPEISALRTEAAEALALADMINEDKVTFCRNSLIKIADYIRSRSGIALKVNADNEQTTDLETQSEPADSNAATDRPDQTAEDRLTRLLSQDSLSAENKNLVTGLLESAQAEKIQSLLLKVLYKFKPGDAAVISWLEESLGRSNTQNSILVLKLLAEMSPARLLPHLPILCLSEDDPLSIQAIRLFRKHNSKLFLKQIEKWLLEDREVTWKAARAAMLMMKIEDSRNILTRAFFSTQRVSLIKFFSPIFRVSPDHLTLYELERLLDTCRGKKREVLQEEIILLKESLGLISQTETKSGDNEQKFAALQITWDEFCKGLEKIRYISQNQKFTNIMVAFFNQHQTKMAMLVLALLAIIFWPDTEISRPTIDSSQSLKTEFELIRQPPAAKVGEIKVFELESYDPINRLWQARSLSGDIFKLKLTNFGDYKKGDRGNFRITNYRISNLGFPVITCTPAN